MRFSLAISLFLNTKLISYNGSFPLELDPGPRMTRVGTEFGGMLLVLIHNVGACH